MRILALSDTELKQVYSSTFSSRYQDIDLLISCGDLGYAYLEFAMSALNRTLYYVNGNHQEKYSDANPSVGIDLHARTLVGPQNTLLAGIEGSGWYNGSKGQYNQAEMWSMVLQLVPKLISNKAIHGRYLDIFVTHAPPWGIHDGEDLPHQGIKAFRWLDKNFQPRLHLHGHVHLYRNDANRITDYYRTTIINCYGFQDINTNFTHRRRWPLTRREGKNGRTK